MSGAASSEQREQAGHPALLIGARSRFQYSRSSRGVATTHGLVTLSLLATASSAGYVLIAPQLTARHCRAC